MQTFVKAIALGIGLLCPMAATAQDVITYEFDGSFEDGTFALENAIIDRGLVIDYVSHVGEMLARTGADVGSDVELFNNADIYLFCSAAVSRRVMEADPMNIVHCPYSIFVADMGDGVVFGHRAYPDGPMQEVEALLDAIIIEAREQ
ncbi:DUF302 domain-containing protein [Jannaschia sp. EhC01]|nr:DUF302 domain-containing protein [Jannaschia sp. EhC01]